MTPDLKAALQESLKQEDEAVKARLQEPAPEATPPKAPDAEKPKARRVPARERKSAPASAPPKPEKAKPAAKEPAPSKTATPKAKLGAEPKKAAAEAAKAVKVSRESFSLPETEAAALKSLRTALAREGRIATKSELVRAGIKLLTVLPTAELSAALDTLPPVVKKKKKK